LLNKIQIASLILYKHLGALDNPISFVHKEVYLYDHDLEMLLDELVTGTKIERIKILILCINCNSNSIAKSPYVQSYI